MSEGLSAPAFAAAPDPVSEPTVPEAAPATPVAAESTRTRKRMRGTPTPDEVGGATLRDVAEHAGFSMATVSRVLSGRGSVLRETAELIRQAAQQLGYRPDRAAQALAMRSAVVRQRRSR